jgi:hypothetical protein
MDVGRDNSYHPRAATISACADDIGGELDCGNTMMDSTSTTGRRRDEQGFGTLQAGSIAHDIRSYLVVDARMHLTPSSDSKAGFPRQVNRSGRMTGSTLIHRVLPISVDQA